MQPKHFTIAALLLSIGFLALYFETFASILEVWSTKNDYHHGYLIFVTIIYLLISDRHNIYSFANKPNYFFLLLTLLLSLSWSIFSYLGIEILCQLLLPAIILSTCGALFGGQLFLRLLLPFSLIYLSIPVWDYLREPLQYLTTTVAGNTLNYFGIPAFISGYYVEIPNGNFEVAGGCAGIRYLTAGLTVAIVYSHWFCSQLKDRVLIITLGILLSLISNWLRVFIIIVIGYQTDMKSPLIEDHNNFGWILFAGILLLFFLLAKRLVPETSNNPYETPIPSKQILSKDMSAGHLITLALLAFATPIFANYYFAQEVKVWPEVSSPNSSEWHQVSKLNSSWSPNYISADKKNHSRHTQKKQKTDLFLYSYINDSQEKNSELINYNNTITDNIRWKSTNKSKIKLFTEHLSFNANIEIIQNKKLSDKRVVISWFLVNNTFTDSRIKAKLLKLMPNKLRTPPPTLVAYSSACLSDCQQEIESLRELIKLSAYQLQYIPEKK